MSDTQVRPVDFGEAANITLDQYYSLLKTQLGNWGSEEFLQLKLIADPVAISDEHYRYWSQYNLLTRSDIAIEPTPVAGTIVTGVEQLNRVYETFITRLRQFVVRKELSEEDVKRSDELTVHAIALKDRIDELAEKEYTKWQRHCERTGTSPGDTNKFLQWRIYSGYGKEIADLIDDLKNTYFKKRTILNRQYADPEDRRIVDAEFDFESPAMRLRYPISPDHMYPDYKTWTLAYLAGLPPGSSAQFDDRRAVTWNLPISYIETTSAGAMSASYDRNTQASESIKTDWGGSASGSYKFISVSASASEHKSISEDFKKGTQITVGAKAAFKVQIVYPGWFRPDLFNSKRVKENIRDFAEFFGPKGSLLYYPTHLIILRGFSAEFVSSQAWSYDYERKFSAEAGGGFNVAGISFGAKGNYKENVEKHKVDKSNTSLKFSDGDSTLRFVGYVVKRNIVGNSLRGGVKDTLSPVTEPGEAAEGLASTVKEGDPGESKVGKR